MIKTSSINVNALQIKQSAKKIKQKEAVKLGKMKTEKQKLLI